MISEAVVRQVRTTNHSWLETPETLMMINTLILKS